MKYLIFFLLGFVLVYLFYLFTVILQKKKYEKYRKSNQVLYFVNRYKIDGKKIDMKKFTNMIGLVNSFIIATAFMATLLVENIFLMLLVGLIVIVPLLLISYHIIGKYYQKKEGNKNV